MIIKLKDELTIDIPNDANTSITLLDNKFNFRTYVPDAEFNIHSFKLLTKLPHYGHNLTYLTFLRKIDLTEIKIWLISKKYTFYTNSIDFSTCTFIARMMLQLKKFSMWLIKSCSI